MVAAPLGNRADRTLSPVHAVCVGVCANVREGT